MPNIVRYSAGKKPNKKRELVYSPLERQYIPLRNISERSSKVFRKRKTHTLKKDISDRVDELTQKTTVLATRTAIAKAIHPIFLEASSLLRTYSYAKGPLAGRLIPDKKAIVKSKLGTRINVVVSGLKDYFKERMSDSVNDALTHTNSYLLKNYNKKLTSAQQEAIKRRLMYRWEKSGLEYDQWRDNASVGKTVRNVSSAFTNAIFRIKKDADGIIDKASTTGRNVDVYRDIFSRKTMFIEFGRKGASLFGRQLLTQTGLNYTKYLSGMLEYDKNYLNNEVLKESFITMGFAFVQWHHRNDHLVCPICRDYGDNVHIDVTEFPELSGATYDSLKGVFPVFHTPITPHPHCYSDDTEVYTNRGWIRFNDIQLGDTFLSLNPDNYDLEYVSFCKYIKYPYLGKLVHLHNRSFDLLVTPEHSQFYEKISRSRGRDKVVTKKFDSILKVPINNVAIYRSSEWKGFSPLYIFIGKRRINFKVFCRFMGYYLSEGSVTLRNGTYQIKISQNDDINRFAILNSLKYFPYKLDLGKEAIYIFDKDLGKFLYQFGKSSNKFVPDVIKNAIKEDIEVFLKAFNLGDGSIRKGKKWNGQFLDSRLFFSSSKRMADDIGELILKIGKRPSFSINYCKGKKQKFNNGVYTINNNVHIITECHRQRSYMHKLKIEPYNYGGFVYDVELEKFHTLLVRRNGKVCWSGNCRCYITPVRLAKVTIQERVAGVFKDYVTNVVQDYVTEKTEALLLQNMPKQLQDLTIGEMTPRNLTQIAMDNIVGTLAGEMGLDLGPVYELLGEPIIRTIETAEKDAMKYLLTYIKSQRPTLFKGRKIDNVTKHLLDYLNDPIAFEKANKVYSDFFKRHQDTFLRKGLPESIEAEVIEAKVDERLQDKVRDLTPTSLTEKQHKSKLRTRIIQEEQKQLAEQELLNKQRLIESSVYDEYAKDLAITSRDAFNQKDLVKSISESTITKIKVDKVEDDIRRIFARIIKSKKIVTREQILDELLDKYSKFKYLDRENTINDINFRLDFLLDRKRILDIDGNLVPIKDIEVLKKKEVTFNDLQRITTKIVRGQRLTGKSLKRAVLREIIALNTREKIRTFTVDELSSVIKKQHESLLARLNRQRKRKIPAADNIIVNPEEVQKILDEVTEKDIQSIFTTKRVKGVLQKEEETIRLLTKVTDSKTGVDVYSIPPNSWEEWDKIHKGPIIVEKEIPRKKELLPKEVKIESAKRIRFKTSIPTNMNILPTQNVESTSLGNPLLVENARFNNKIVDTLVYDWSGNGGTVLVPKGYDISRYTDFTGGISFRKAVIIRYNAKEGLLEISPVGFGRLTPKQYLYIESSVAKYLEQYGGWGVSEVGKESLSTRIKIKTGKVKNSVKASASLFDIFMKQMKQKENFELKKQIRDLKK